MFKAILTLQFTPFILELRAVCTRQTLYLPEAWPLRNVTALGRYRVLYAASSAPITWSSRLGAIVKMPEPYIGTHESETFPRIHKQNSLAIVTSNSLSPFFCSWSNIRRCVAVRMRCATPVIYRFVQYIFLLTFIKRLSEKGYENCSADGTYVSASCDSECLFVCRWSCSFARHKGTRGRGGIDPLILKLDDICRW